jgi:hypothetical protein
MAKDVEIEKEKYKINNKDIYSILFKKIKKFKVIISYDIFNVPYLDGNDGPVDITEIPYHDFYNTIIENAKPDN